MASRALWSPDELQVLESHIDKPDWLKSVCGKITGRTVKSIKVRMAKLRTEQGVGDGRRVDGAGDEWMIDAVLASQTLLERTLRVGVWS